MSEEMVKVFNTHNGRSDFIPKRFFLNPLYNKYLTDVDPDQKDFVPELYKSRELEDYEAPRRGRKPKSESESEVEETEDVIEDTESDKDEE